MNIIIKKLDTGYYQAHGNGLCELAQWPIDEELKESHFFLEASKDFRKELYSIVKELNNDR